MLHIIDLFFKKILINYRMVILKIVDFMVLLVGCLKKWFNKVKLYRIVV